MNMVFYGIRCKSKINFVWYELLFSFGYAIDYKNTSTYFTLTFVFHFLPNPCVLQLLVTKTIYHATVLPNNCRPSI